jgi:pimeloyl-ACP methyl ester carboxylesterase
MLVYAEAGILIGLFRVACLGGCLPRLGLTRQLLAGVWLALGAWIIGAFLHAWVPIWQVLALGLGLGACIAALRTKMPIYAQPAADLVAVPALGLLSVVPVSTLHVVMAATVFTVGGAALDRFTRRLPARTQGYLILAPAIMTLLICLNVRQPSDFGERLLSQDPLFPLRLALAAPIPGERVKLPSGAIGWLLRNPGSHSRGTAILLHGNHPAASSQPAAIALQGALLRAGYDVFSVDHPGYGASPQPGPNSGLSAWDPTLGPRDALAYIRANSQSSAPATILVAHSMGVDTALQWLKNRDTVQDVYLFAGATTRPAIPPQDDIALFYARHRIPCCLPREIMKPLTERFYSGADRYARALPQSHAFVHYVQFGIEYWDVAVDRELLYAAIPEQKLLCNLNGVTHYLNTLSLRRFVLVDTRTTVRVGELFVGPGTAPCP